MNIFVSPVFNGTIPTIVGDNHDISVIPFGGKRPREYGNFDEKPNDPWTFFIVVEGFIFTPKHLDYPKCGFSHRREADLARQFLLKRIEKHFENGVWISKINTDNIEGRGSMIVEKVFKDPKNAYAFMQDHIPSYKKNEQVKIFVECNVKGGLYLSVYDRFDPFREVTFVPFAD